MSLSGLIAAFACALALTGAIRVLAIRFGFLDVPNDRSSHAAAVPRGGGLAIALVTLAGLLILWSVGVLHYGIAIGLGGAGVAIALLGWLDDRYGLSAALRLGVQVIAGLWFVAWCADPLHIGLDIPAGTLGAALWWLFIFLALLWATNLFNFMDGIDGLAGGQAVYMGGMGVWLLAQSGDAGGLGSLLGILAAASAGFLVWNLSPSRIFLGDVGSCFLGFMLAANFILVSATSAIPLTTWAIVAGTFLVDATITLVFRMLRRENLAVAHRTHLYQRLAIAWGSHRRVTAVYLAVNVLWLAPLATWSVAAPALSPWIAVLALTPLVVACVKLGNFGRV